MIMRKFGLDSGQSIVDKVSFVFPSFLRDGT